MENDTRRAAKLLWDYMQMHQPVLSADALVVLGSRDDRVASHAASLLNNDIAPICVVTGGGST